MPATNGILQPIYRFSSRHLLRVEAFLVMCLLFLAGCSASEDSWARIQESGTLRVGIDPTFPPFALADGETITGIDVDVAKALAAELELNPQFTYFGYDGLYDALTTGQVDVLVSALVIAPERTKEIAYTIPYYDAGLVLVKSASDSQAITVEALAGSTVAVELGALSHVVAQNWQARVENLKILPYSDIAGAIAAVSTGEARVAFVDSVSGYLYLRDQPDAAGLEIVPEPITSEPYAIAVRIDDRVLLTRLNEALARLSDEGRLQEIIERHLGHDAGQ